VRLEWWLSTLPLRWRSLFRRDEVERDLDDEIRDHLELEIEHYVAGGVDRLEARRLAMRAFGGVDQAKERCRDMRGVGWIEMLVQDVWYGARTLRSAPAFTVVAVLTLALGIPDWMDGTIYVPHSVAGTLEDACRGPPSLSAGGAARGRSAPRARRCRIPTEMTLTLRTTMPPAQAAAVLRRLPAVSDDVVIADVQRMDGVVADALAGPAATTSLLAFMAMLALVLGCVGVYGVLSFLVSRQTRDLGIRFALGAQRRNVFWLVIRQGAVLCLAGIAIGIAGALAVTRWLSSELYGVTPTDPMTFVVVAAVMSLVTLTACYVPTRRAMAVDPLILLHDQ